MTQRFSSISCACSPELEWPGIPVAVTVTLSKPLLFSGLGQKCILGVLTVFQRMFTSSGKVWKCIIWTNSRKISVSAPRKSHCGAYVPHLVKAWVWLKDRQRCLLLSYLASLYEATLEHRVLCCCFLIYFSKRNSVLFPSGISHFLSFLVEFFPGVLQHLQSLTLFFWSHSFLIGMQMGSTAVHDAIKFRHLLYGKQAWEIPCDAGDPAGLWRMCTRTGAQLSGTRWPFHLLRCLSHAGRSVIYCPPPPLRECLRASSMMRRKDTLNDSKSINKSVAYFQFLRVHLLSHFFFSHLSYCFGSLLVLMSIKTLTR